MGKQKNLPKGWTYVEVRKLEITYKEKDGKTVPVINDVGLKKHIKMPSDQLQVLNSQSKNTLLKYVAVDHAPKAELTAKEIEDIAKVEAKKAAELEVEKLAKIKADLKIEILDEIKLAAKTTKMPKVGSKKVGSKKVGDNPPEPAK